MILGWLVGLRDEATCILAVSDWNVCPWTHRVGPRVSQADPLTLGHLQNLALMS